MSQGVFFVKFESNIRDFGDGLVFIKDGSVNGSDANFLYQGKLPAQSGELKTQITVQQWQAGNTHVFGGTGGFVLEAHGTVDYEKGVFSLQGSPQGNTQLTLQASGKRIGDVA